MAIGVTVNMKSKFIMSNFILLLYWLQRQKDENRHIKRIGTDILYLNLLYVIFNLNMIGNRKKAGLRSKYTDYKPTKNDKVLPFSVTPQVKQDPCYFLSAYNR